jgi:hypothetical protein
MQMTLLGGVSEDQGTTRDHMALMSIGVKKIRHDVI